MKCVQLHFHLATFLLQISIYKLEVEYSANSQALFQGKHKDHYYALTAKMSVWAGHILASFSYKNRLTVSNVEKE